MTIILIGLNHHTAPVELREQLSVRVDSLRTALGEIRNREYRYLPGSAPALIHEVVMLSTCNRLEIYAVISGDVNNGWTALERRFAPLQPVVQEDLRPHLYFMEGQAAVEHLMRVACGLESLILGEPQILGQVTQAFGDAQAAGTTGPVLSHLFSQAIHAGKRARTETDISRHTTSVSHAAAQLTWNRIGDLSSTRVLIVGAGEMAELAASAFQSQGAKDLACINRTFANAESLAQKIGGRAFNWLQLCEALAWADVVVSATGAPHTVIYANDVSLMLTYREHRPLLFVDIAVPRDIEEGVDALPDVSRFDIDDLDALVDANLTQRKAAVPRVEQIIAVEKRIFLEWMQYRQVSSVITELRRKAETIASEEVSQTIQRMEGLSEHEQELIERLAHRIVNKLLHEPTVCLKAQAIRGNGPTYAHVTRELFMLGQWMESQAKLDEPSQQVSSGN